MKSANYAKCAAIIALGLALGTSAALAGGKHAHDKHDHSHEKRELGAHQHGHGSFAIAIEGQKVAMELRAPGADIVGFEHAAKSKADKAAVKEAKKKLSTALDLFTLPTSAGCTLASADVALEAEGDDHAKGDKHDHGHAHDKKAAKKHDHGEETHSEFHALYELICSAPENLTSLTFNYFAAFKGAEELDVQVIGPKGQTKFEATPAKTTINLGGVI